MLRYLWQPALHAALPQPCRALPHTQLVLPAQGQPLQVPLHPHWVTKSLGMEGSWNNQVPKLA